MMNCGIYLINIYVSFLKLFFDSQLYIIRIVHLHVLFLKLYSKQNMV